jgi:hypothetical protein
MTDGLVRTTERIELPLNGEAILSKVRSILRRPRVMKIIIDAEGSYIDVDWYHEFGASLDDPRTTSETVSDFLESYIELDELSTTETEMKAQIVDGMTRISVSGYIPTHIFVGSIDAFTKSLGYGHMFCLPTRSVSDGPEFLGMRVIEGGILEEGNKIVVAGSNTASKSLVDVVFGLVITLEDEA